MGKTLTVCRVSNQPIFARICRQSDGSFFNNNTKKFVKVDTSDKSVLIPFQKDTGLNGNKLILSVEMIPAEFLAGDYMIDFYNASQVLTDCDTFRVFGEQFYPTNVITPEELAASVWDFRVIPSQNARTYLYNIRLLLEKMFTLLQQTQSGSQK